MSHTKTTRTSTTVDRVAFELRGNHLCNSYCVVLTPVSAERVKGVVVDGVIDNFTLEYSCAKFEIKRTDFDTAVAQARKQADFNEAMTQWFYECVNDSLDDPFLGVDFDSSESDDSDPEFTRGSLEGLKHLAVLFVLTEPDLDEGMRNESLIVRGHDDGNYYGLDGDAGLYSERLKTLFDLALEEHVFTGVTYSYNDGAHDQQSGYCADAKAVGFYIPALLEGQTARDRVKAAAELRTWLHAHGADPAEFLPGEAGDDGIGDLLGADSAAKRVSR